MRVPLSKRRMRSFHRRHRRTLTVGALALLASAAIFLAIPRHPHHPRVLTATTTPTTAPADPMRIIIPKLHVNAPLEQVGLASDGAMQSPSGPTEPAWFKLGPHPGAPGNAVIAGHLDGLNFAPAVFFHLSDLRPGDRITVTDEHGHPWHFQVNHTQAYDTRHAPLDQIFGAARQPHLNLITCTGSWDRSRQQYNDRLVVFTELSK
jgi:sortase A